MDFSLRKESEEKTMMQRLRGAIQFCSDETQIACDDTRELDKDARMKIERCLVQNYLLKHGMDYFGKRDLIYIDMKGTREAEAPFSRKLYERPAFLGEAPEEGGDAEDDDE